VIAMCMDLSRTMMELGGQIYLFPGRYGETYSVDLVGVRSLLFAAQKTLQHIARSTLLRECLIMGSTEVPCFGKNDLTNSLKGAFIKDEGVINEVSVELAVGKSKR
jgi:hypothetical protein